MNVPLKRVPAETASRSNLPATAFLTERLDQDVNAHVERHLNFPGNGTLSALAPGLDSGLVAQVTRPVPAASSREKYEIRGGKATEVFTNLSSYVSIKRDSQVLQRTKVGHKKGPLEERTSRHRKRLAKFTLGACPPLAFAPGLFAGFSVPGPFELRGEGGAAVHPREDGH